VIVRELLLELDGLLIVELHLKDNKGNYLYIWKGMRNMKYREKLVLLEDMLELEEGELKEEMRLSELEGWDSMAKLSLIVLMDDEFSKKLSGDQIRGFETIKDILDFME